jgi:hypothetical protein
MPRIRSIKPEFFTSLDVASLSIRARLTFIGLWTYVDDHGRGLDDSRLIKAAVWPLDTTATPNRVDSWLAEMAARNLIVRYEVDGRRYLHVSKWSDHQRVDHPSPSRMPPLPLASDSRSPREDPRSSRARAEQGTGKGTGNREQGTGSKEGIPALLAKYLAKLTEHSPRAFRSVQAERLLEIADDEGIAPNQAARFLADVWDWWQTAPPSKRWKRPERGWRTWCRREAARAPEPSPQPPPSANGPPVFGSPEWRQRQAEMQELERSTSGVS